MSERIAEFLSSDDAWAFRNMKGRDAYEVVGGITLPWAVMPKIQYATNLGNPESPPDWWTKNYDEDER
jgi:hypothetical protein